MIFCIKKGLFIFLFLFHSFIFFAQAPSIVLPQGHSGEVTSSVFGNKTRYILTGGVDGTARLWDYGTGRLIRVYSQPGQNVRAVLSEDESILLVYGNKIDVYLIQKDSLLFSVDNIFPKQVTLSPDNKYIAAVVNDRCQIWSITNKKLIKEISNLGYGSFYAGFTQDSRKIITTYYEYPSRYSLTITRLDPTEISGIPESYKLPCPSLKLLKLSADENYLAILTGLPYRLIIYDLRRQTILITHDISYSESSVAFSHDNKNVFLLDCNRLVTWDCRLGAIPSILSLSPDPDSTLHKDFIHVLPDNQTVLAFRGNSLYRIDRNKMKIADKTILQEFLINDIIPDKTGGFFLVNSYYGSTVYSTRSSHANFSLGSTSGIFSLSETGSSNLLAGLSDGSAGIWNIRNGRLINRISFDNSSVHIVSTSPDKKYCLLVSGSKIFIYDSSLNILLFKLDSHESEVVNAEYSSDGSKILTSSDDCHAVIWDAITGKMIRNLNSPGFYSLGAFYLNSARQIALHKRDDSEDQWLIYNAETGTVDHTLTSKNLKTGNHQFSNQFSFSPTSEYMSILMQEGLSGGYINIINTQKGTIVKKIIQSNISMFEFSPSGNNLAIGSDNGKVSFWNTKQFTRLREINAPRSEATVNGIVYNSAENTAALFYDDNVLKVVHLDNRQTEKVIQLGVSIPIDGLFTNKDSLLLIHTTDHLTHVWDVVQGKQIYEFGIFRNGEFISIIPSGEYMTPRNMLKQISFRLSNSLISAQQLDLQFNRPDKVLTAIGSRENKLIQSYSNAYVKRIERFSIDTNKFNTDFSLPNLEISNRDTIRSYQAAPSVILHLKASSDKHSIQSLNLWINAVPLYGRDGLNMSASNLNFFDTTISVQLTSGNNRIEISIIDKNGSESYRRPLWVQYTPAVIPVEKTWFIGIGVNSYKNHPCRNLFYAVKDINDLDSLFNPARPNVYKNLLLDSSATRENILALKNELMKTQIHDKVIIALSGHGILHQQKDFYFGTYDIDFNKPDQKGLKYEELASLLDDIPARKKLLLIDACHSGETDTSQSVKQQTDVITNPCITDNRKTDDPEKLSNPGIGLENSFELMKDLFIDPTMGNGAVVISAAKGLGFAEENKTWQNGAFTLCIKAAFSGNTQFSELKETADKNADGVSVNELKDYILEIVPKITNNRQKPTIRKENIEADWKIK